MGYWSSPRIYSEKPGIVDLGFLSILTAKSICYTLNMYTFTYLLIFRSRKVAALEGFMPLDSSHHPGQTVGAKLRAARLAKRYTQSQLAHPDFSISYISAIERGQIQPSLRALEILAQRLGMNTTHLLSPQGSEGGGQSAEEKRVSLAQEERDLLLIEAQVAIRRGDPTHAISLLRPLVQQKDKHILTATVYYMLGWAYLEGGYVQESESSLAEAAKMSRGTTDPLYPRIISLRGAMYAAVHKMEQALQLQLAGLAAQEQWPDHSRDLFFLVQIYTSLGLGYSHLEQFAEALEMFQRALALLQSQPSLAQLQALYWNIAEYYAAQAQPFWAALYNQKWQQAELQERLITLKSNMQHNLGRALLKSNVEQAYEALLALAQEASAQQDPLGRASALTHLAAWFIARKDFGQAESYALEAHLLASPFGETIISADLLILQGEIAYARQEYEQGDQFFTSGLALFERLQQKEELIEHLTRYACLLEERELIHKAIIYWKRAYENRQRN